MHFNIVELISCLVMLIVAVGMTIYVVENCRYAKEKEREAERNMVVQKVAKQEKDGIIIEGYIVIRPKDDSEDE